MSPGLTDASATHNPSRLTTKEDNIRTAIPLGTIFPVVPRDRKRQSSKWIESVFGIYNKCRLNRSSLTKAVQSPMGV